VLTAEDARLPRPARLADYLRAQNTPTVIDELNEINEQIGHRVRAGTVTGEHGAGRLNPSDPAPAHHLGGRRPGPGHRCPPR